MNKMVITCAICGAETTKEHNPNLPVTPQELAQSTYEAYKAGASIVHLHVRDKEGKATMDVAIFEEAIKLIREKCDIVIEVTTGGGVGMSDEERMQVLELKPEMASLDCGTVNFGDEFIVNTLPSMRNYAKKMKEYGVRPTLECFDLSHIYAAEVLIKEGLVEPPFHYGFVLNVPGGVKYDVETLDFFVRRIPKASFWTVMGIGGRASLLSHYGALSLNGFIRVGFEDNVYYSKGVLAESNAQLVERAVRIAKEGGYEIAAPADVRELLKIRTAK
jgi:3-keto-5-aminohexanoate cleavage enzyme